MKNKKIKLLAAFIGSISTTFGSIYAISLAQASNKSELVLSQNDKNVDNHKNFASAPLPPEYHQLPFSSFVSGSNIKGDLIYEINEECKTIRIVGSNLVSGDNVRFFPRVSIQGGEYSYAVTAINNHAFDGCSQITGMITLPEELVTIGDYAFNGCTGITGTLKIPSSVTTIGDHAFDRCTGLNSSLVLPNRLKYLGDYAFSNCSSIQGTVKISNFITPFECKIGRYAFESCTHIEKVILPNNITKIDTGAFISCTALKEINLPESLEVINDSVFKNCSSLKFDNLNLPENLTTINASAFEGCSQITGTLTIPNSITQISSYCFKGCSNIENIVFSEKLEVIDDEAFSGCNKITSLDFPETLERIYKEAFFQSVNTSLTSSLKIPESVKMIGDHAFYNSANTSTEIKYTVEGIGLNVWCLGLIGNATRTFSDNLTIKDGTYAIAESAFDNSAYPNKSLINAGLSLPSSLQYIGYYAFRNQGITSISGMGATKIYKIGDYAFDGCNNLTGKIDIPNKIACIGAWAFRNCSKITSLNIIADSSRNYTCSIERSVFENCSSLTGRLLIPSYVDFIGDKAFYNTKFSKDSSNILYSSGEDIGYSKWCIGIVNSTEVPTIKDLPIDNGTVGIAGGAFEEYQNLSSVTFIGPNAKYIGPSAFKSCVNLSSIQLSSDLEGIYDYAFDACTSLAEIPFNVVNNPKLKFIGDGAFNNCTNMKGSVQIGDNVSTLGDDAFSGCKNVIEAIITGTDNLAIGNRVFQDCESMTSISINNENLTAIPSNFASGCKKIIKLDLPNSLKEINSSAFQNCIGLTSISLPKWIKTIGDSAFEGCKGLSTIGLPDSLSTIGKKAFKDCVNLCDEDRLVIPSTVKEIGSNAFNGCINISKMKFESMEAPILHSNWLLEDENVPSSTKIEYHFGAKNNYFNANLEQRLDFSKYYDLTDFNVDIEKTSFNCVQNAEDKIDLVCHVTTNDGASNYVQYSLTPAGELDKMPSWISIDSATGIISIKEDSSLGTYKFNLTVASQQDENFKVTKTITINVNKMSIWDNWWIWIIVVVCLVTIIGSIALLMIATSKGNKKYK